MIGPKPAQVSLSFGVDDLDGTVAEEKIAHDAGAATGHFMSKALGNRLIKAVGRIPVKRDTIYNVLRRVFSVQTAPRAGGIYELPAGKLCSGRGFSAP